MRNKRGGRNTHALRPHPHRLAPALARHGQVVAQQTQLHQARHWAERIDAGGALRHYIYFNKIEIFINLMFKNAYTVKGRNSASMKTPTFAWCRSTANHVNIRY
jgi:penicillin-binding protein-related factor A (putative recombinase)